MPVDAVKRWRRRCLGRFGRVVDLLHYFTFDVIECRFDDAQFQQALAELHTDKRKNETIENLTDGQRQTLEWVGSAMGTWKSPQGVTTHQVASCKVQHLNRQPTSSEVENTRKQLRALHADGLLSKRRRNNSTLWRYSAENG